MAAMRHIAEIQRTTCLLVLRDPKRPSPIESKIDRSGFFDFARDECMLPTSN